jgi:N-acetylmuramoyl-L-alanine amidase-like protein
MAQGPSGDDHGPHGPAVDRRGLLRLGLAAGTLVGVPALITRRAGSTTRSPFDAPFDASAPRTARGARRARRAAPPATIVSRSDWRADERLRSRAIDYDATVEKIVVHHTGTASDERDWPSVVRAIYRNCVARGYRDVPYHWLIDPDGFVYEGRWARHDRPGAVPTGEDSRGRSVRGGHAKGHNERTIGVALLGTFDDHPPPSLAFDALIALVAWKCSRWRIDPMDATAYRMSDGTREVIPNICPHRRIRATDCPGRGVVDVLPELRVAVAQRIA